MNAHAMPIDDDEAEAATRRDARRARRVRRQLRLQRDNELNIVSMIDVFAVLMFFLLVTSSISAARLNILALDLPAKSTVATAKPETRPSIRLLDDALLVDIGNGRLQRLKKSEDGAQLAALLLIAKQRAPMQDGIDLLVAPEISYADVIAVMDAIRLATPEAKAAGYPAELFPKVAIGEAPAEGARR